MSNEEETYGSLLDQAIHLKDLPQAYPRYIRYYNNQPDPLYKPPSRDHHFDDGKFDSPLHDLPFQTVPRNHDSDLLESKRVLDHNLIPRYARTQDYTRMDPKPMPMKQELSRVCRRKPMLPVRWNDTYDQRNKANMANPMSNFYTRVRQADLRLLLQRTDRSPQTEIRVLSQPRFLTSSHGKPNIRDEHVWRNIRDEHVWRNMGGGECMAKYGGELQHRRMHIRTTNKTIHAESRNRSDLPDIY